MKTEIKLIQPQWAKQMLDTRNPHNRTLNMATCKSFALEMKAGRWALTHQGIAFNEHGDLIDGQHRLMAIILSGQPVRMMVATEIAANHDNGIRFATMDVVDTGRKRGIGQQLNLSHQWTRGNHAAAIARAIAIFYCNSKLRFRINTPMTLAIIQTCESSLRAIHEIATRNPKRCNARIAAAITIYHTVCSTDALDFYNSYLDMVGWEEESPVRALDRWRQNFPKLSNGDDSTRATAAALFAYENVTGMKILRISDTTIDWLQGFNTKLRSQVKKIIGEK